MSNKLKTFSQNISSDLGGGLDPATVVTIIYIVIEIVKYIQACNKPVSDILPNIRKPGLIDKMRVQAQIRKKLKGRAYHKYGKKIAEAIFKRCENISKKEISDIFDEVARGEKF